MLSIVILPYEETAKQKLGRNWGTGNEKLSFATGSSALLLRDAGLQVVHAGQETTQGDEAAGCQ